MKSWSLNAKVAFSLGVLSAGAVTIGYFGLSKMGYINGLLTEISGVMTKRDQMTSYILDQQRQVAILSRDIIIEKKLEEMERMEKELTPVREKLFKLVEEYSAIASPKGKELAAAYLEAAKAWTQTNRKIRELTKAGKDAEVDLLVINEERPLGQKALKVLEEMNVLTAANLAAATEEAQSSYRNARTLVVTICALAILLGAAIAFAVMRAVSKSIDRVIHDLNENSQQVTGASQQIAASSEQLSQAATEQAASLQETAASIEEMNSMIQKNSENAQKSSEVSRSSQESATKGKIVVQDMIRTIEEINAANNDIVERITESNRQIGEIVQVIAEIGNKTRVINDIVFQTKLLSFNASVEAARAGEHGKGFAVVAEEVGNLAQMSGNAAKEISSMLEGSSRKVEGIVQETKGKIESLVSVGKSKVDAGTQVAQQCGEVLTEIVTNVESVSKMVAEISMACQEQAKGIQEITKAMGQLDQVTQENASTSEEAASSAEELSAQSVALGGVVKLLVETVKGGSSQAAASLAQAPVRTGAEKKGNAQVVSLKSARARKNAVEAPRSVESGKEGFKKAAGGYENGSIPSGDDSRFEDA